MEDSGLQIHLKNGLFKIRKELLGGFRNSDVATLTENADAFGVPSQ